MTFQEAPVRNLRLAWLCLVLGIVAIWIASALATVVDMTWFGAQSFRLFHHSPRARAIDYLAVRVLTLVACILLAKVRTRQDFVARFSLCAARPNYFVIAAISGIWLSTFLEYMHPGRFAHLRFEPSLSFANITLLIAPFLEEAIMRGFFYQAFRTAFGVAISIAFTIAVDAVLFHWGILRLLEPLAGVVLLNLVACLLRERSGSLWPCIVLHVSYNLLFFFFRW